MTGKPKQWAATGFVVGIASGIAVAIAIFLFTRAESAAVARPMPAPVASSMAALKPSSSGPLIAGTIDLDPSAKVALPAVMFVIARTEGQAKGHPVLAKRIDVTAFPVSFSLSSTDAMMDQSPPQRVLLEARIDLDGDAITRDAGAPSASIPSVPLGANDVTVVLK
jgi:hypothetical protein